MQMNEDQMAPFLHACLSADLNTCFPNSDVDSALKQTKLFVSDELSKVSQALQLS